VEKIAVMAGGFVGTYYAFVFANGYKIVLYDIDLTKLKNFKIKKFLEGLFEFLKSNEELWNSITFTSGLDKISEIDMYIVSIGTYAEEGHDKNLFSFFKDLDQVLDKTFIIESTVRPGTTRKIKELLEEKGFVYGKDFYLIYNPGFTRAVSSIRDILNPDKIVAGINHQEEKEIIEKLCSFIQSDRAERLKEKKNIVHWYDDIKEKKEIEGIKPCDLKEKYDIVLITKNVDEKILNIVNAEMVIGLKAYLNFDL